MIGSRKLAVALSLMSSLAVACGGSDGSTFGNGNGTGDNGHDPNAGAGPFADQSGPSGTHDACVSSVANAKLTPVNLVMMFDKSGSMGDVNNQPTPYDPNLKWNPVTAGMKSFLGDPASSTMSASLQFFPQGNDIAGVCGYDYATPMVSLTPLATPQPFTDAINATSPSGGTPTLPALQGAISYAKQISAQRAGEKSVVVLITDGEPGMMVNGSFQPGCTDNDIPHVAAAADAAYKGTPSIPTYVIGVGPSLDKLNAIAAAGGTGAAMMVDVSDPSKTSGIFQSALTQIRGQQLTCNFAIPPAPDGKQIDTNAVNVVYTGASGVEQVLTYSADCSVAGGWHYDNLAAPTQIQLCASACQTAQSDAAGKLSLAFGCLTKTALK